VSWTEAQMDDLRSCCVQEPRLSSGYPWAQPGNAPYDSGITACDGDLAARLYFVVSGYYHFAVLCPAYKEVGRVD